jgi:FAD/FMN-containing dehydrogenase
MFSYLGKSTGTGALSIWTHHLSSTEPILNYTSRHYTGPAIKLGAGVQAAAALAVAQRLGYRVVAGHTGTVGIAGGFSMGAGDSPLTSLYGLGADNVLEWDLVLADGTRTTASPTHNTDLYWAFCGGGGGTYAVAVATTVKMHRDGPTGGALLTFNATSSNASAAATPSSASAAVADAYWSAAEVMHSQLGSIVDSGGVLMTIYTNSSINAWLTAPGQTEEQARALLQPTTDHLARSGLSFSLSSSVDATYLGWFERYHGPLPEGQFTSLELITSRLIPRELYETPPSASSLSSSSSPRPLLNSNLSSSSPPPSPFVRSLTRLFRDVNSQPGFFSVNVAFKAQALPGTPANAVHPAWRTALSNAVISPAWDWSAPAAANAARQERLTRVYDPALRALAPAGAAYLHEANFRLPRDVLMRESYAPAVLARLRAVKRRYDPDDVFYAPVNGVGSDAWVEDANGRLCRVK